MIKYLQLQRVQVLTALETLTSPQLVLIEKHRKLMIRDETDSDDDSSNDEYNKPFRKILN